MKIQKTILMTGNGMRESLSNMWYGDDCNIGKFDDAVYDSVDTKDLEFRINSLQLLRKFTLDRETEIKIRFKSVDKLGNISFLEFYK